MDTRRPLISLALPLLLAIMLGLIGALAFAGTTAWGARFQPEGPAGLLTSADFTVNDPADPGNPTCTLAQCSLRAAIVAANGASFTTTQTIDFNLTYPLTITLSSPLPVITGTVAISGPGSANLTISGADQYRVFEVDSGASLDLSGLAIRQGSDALRGGGILIDNGTLWLSDSLLVDNRAGSGDGGGLYNDGGTVNITGSTLADNHAFHDGAITNSGVMTVTESLFKGNQARVAGAIDNSGTLTILSSTFTENVAPIANGGAILNSGTVVVANSTFFDNGSPLGADIYNGGTVNVTNSTFYSATIPSMNSIVSSGINATLTLSNTLIAAGPVIDNCDTLDSGTLNAGADNLATDMTCDSATVVTMSELLLGTSLADNGGSTPTVAIYPGSVAIDAGDDSLCAAPIGAPNYGAGGEDQRGVIRPQAAHCDVGAFEQFPIRHSYLPMIPKDHP